MSRLTQSICELENKLKVDTVAKQLMKYQLYKDAVARASGKRLRNVVVLTLCINYADKLKLTLKNNARMFKRFYVITVKEDIETIDVCSKYENVECIITEKLHFDNAVFNKSAMIHDAQAYLHEKFPKKWILLLDSDIALPRRFPKIIQAYGKLDPQKLYGMHRVDFHKQTDYIKLRNYVIYNEEFVGFFQLYFDKTKMYPPSSNNCAVCDIVFREMFAEKEYINDFDSLYHLGQEGVNWNGRVSEQWK